MLCAKELATCQQDGQDLVANAVAAAGEGQWIDEEFPPDGSSLFLDEDVSDTVHYDCFERLGTVRMNHGGEGELVLSLHQDGREMVREVTQGEFGTCYLLSVIQCAAMMLKATESSLHSHCTITAPSLQGADG